MLRKFRIFVLLLAITVSSTHIRGQRNFRIYFTSVSTKSFSNDLKLNSSVDRKVGSVSLYMNVLTNIYKPYVAALGYTESSNGRYDLELFNLTIDVCMVFGNKHYEPWLQVGLRILKKETGVLIPTRCPIVKRLYSIKDVIINPEFLPPIMPEKRAFVKLTFLSKDDTILKDLGMHSGYVRIEKLGKTKA